MVRYWLTPPIQPFHPSQSGLLPQRPPCYHPSWEWSWPAASGPPVDLALFSEMCRCKQGKHNVAAETHTCKHLITTCCYAIITHKAFKDGTWAILSFSNDLRHSWRQSNNLPARPQTFKHLDFTPMRTAKLMSWIAMETLCFFTPVSPITEIILWSVIIQVKK